jgi:hypothetical protein
MYLRELELEECGVDAPAPGYAILAASYEHGNESVSYTIKVGCLHPVACSRSAVKL